MLKLAANVNGLKKVKNQLNFLLILKIIVRKQEINGKEICDQSKNK